MKKKKEKREREGAAMERAEEQWEAKMAEVKRKSFGGQEVTWRFEIE